MQNDFPHQLTFIQAIYTVQIVSCLHQHLVFLFFNHSWIFIVLSYCGLHLHSWRLVTFSFFSDTYCPLSYSSFLVKCWFKYFVSSWVESPCLLIPDHLRIFVYGLFFLLVFYYLVLFSGMFGIFHWMLKIMYEKL